MVTATYGHDNWQRRCLLHIIENKKRNKKTGSNVPREESTKYNSQTSEKRTSR